MRPMGRSQSLPALPCDDDVQPLLWFLLASTEARLGGP